MGFVNINTNFSIDSPDNFWVQNPQMIYFEPYSELYNSDVSPNHSHSSRTMWVINFMQNPDDKENIFYRMSYENRKNTLSKTFHPELDWEDELFNKCYNSFPRDSMDSIKRSLKTIADSFDKNTRLIASTELTLDKTEVKIDPNSGKEYAINIKGTSSQILKIQKDINVIMERFEKIYDKYVSNKSKTKAVGNATISKGESGGFW